MILLYYNKTEMNNSHSLHDSGEHMPEIDDERDRVLEIVEIGDTATDDPNIGLPQPYTEDPIPPSTIKGWERLLEEIKRNQNLY